MAEVSAAHSRGGQRDEVACRVDHVAVYLIVEEEERLVVAVVELGNPDWAAYGAAKVVLAAARVGIGERPVRVQRFVGQVLIPGAMELIGAGAGSEVVEPASSLAEFRGKVAGLQGELLDHIHGRLRHRGGPADVVLAGGILPFHLYPKRAGRQAVDVGCVTTVRSASARHTRRKHVERIRAAHRSGAAAAAAEVQGQLVDALASDHGALFGRFGLQQRCIGSDGDCFD